MGYYPELDRLEEMKKNCWDTEDLREIKREEAYLAYQGHGYYDYDTGRFVYTGPQEMGG